MVGARFALMGKGKHTLMLGAWHGSPPDDPPKSYIDMQQSKSANLSGPLLVNIKLLYPHRD